MHHHDLTSVPLPEQLSPNAELLDDLAELYKIFGDSTRIKILYTLFTEERGVGDIARLLGMTMSAISHQLRILKAGPAGKAPSRREDGILCPGR